MIGVVCGHPIIKTPGGTQIPATIHSAEHQLFIQHTEPGELFDYVGACEQTVDAWIRENSDQPIEKFAPICQRKRSITSRDDRACRVIGRNDEELAVSAHQRSAAASGEGVNECSWSLGAILQ